MYTERPEGLTVGVIGAMASEIDALKAAVEEPETMTISGVEYVSGRMGNVNVIVAKCGIGKVFAAMCAQTMVLVFGPDLVLNIGVGGSLTPGLNIADVGIANAVVQHDMDTTAFGDPLGMVSGINVVEFPCDGETVAALEQSARDLGVHTEKGVIASGDCFVSDDARKKHISENIHAIVCEMEGGAIGHVCYVNQIPFCILRAVSDNGDESAGRDFANALERASDVALEVTRKFLASF